MGYGDDLLVTKLASEIKKKHPNRQIIVGSAKKKSAHHSQRVSRTTSLTLMVPWEKIFPMRNLSEW